MSEEWISASQAREIVAPGWKHNGGPTDDICKRAKAGLVRARALLFVSIRGGEKSEKREHLLPKEFWERERLKQNWAQGDFSNWIHPEGWEIYCEAYDVTFELSGIEAMAPKSRPAAVPLPSQDPARHPKGGAPGKFDWANAVGTVVFQWADSGVWQPKSQGEVQAKLADWFLTQHQTPDDKQLKRYARWLFGEFRKRDSGAE